MLSGKVKGLPEQNEGMAEQQLTPNLTLHALRLPAILPGSSQPERTPCPQSPCVKQQPRFITVYTLRMDSEERSTSPTTLREDSFVFFLRLLALVNKKGAAINYIQNIEK